MSFKTLNYFVLSILVSIVIVFPAFSFSEQEVSLLEVTPRIREYAINTVKPPVLDYYENRDTLSLLLKITDILMDSVLGIHTNKIEPSNFIKTNAEDHGREPVDESVFRPI